MIQNAESISFNRGLAKKDAESVATSINLLLSNAKMFGCKHPSTMNAADELCQKITRITEDMPMITLVKSGNSFAIEKWILDKQLNSARFAKEFDKLHIDSISFMPNVLPWNLTTFAQIYTEALDDNEQSAEKIMAQMNEKEQKGIVLNNIVIKTVATVAAAAMQNIATVEKVEAKVEAKVEPQITPPAPPQSEAKKIAQEENAQDKQKQMPLLSPKATVHFIKRYIEEFFRHKNPFSILMISDKEQKNDGISALSNTIGELIAKGFRFLDISGFLHVRQKDIAVIILPMTDSEGLKAILRRLNKQIDESKQTLTWITVSNESEEEDAKSLGYANIMKKLLKGHA